MTSANEMNAYNRGKRDGYDVGYDNGWKDCNNVHRSNKPVLIVMKIVIALAVGFFLGMASEAHSASATTSLTVVIPVTVSAEVPCTIENREHSITCLQGDDGEVLVYSDIQEEAQPSLISRIFSAILGVFK